MRINIREAGLATYMMAGRGLLPRDEQEPRPETDNRGVVEPILLKPAKKDEQH